MVDFVASPDLYVYTYYMFQRLLLGAKKAPLYVLASIFQA